MQVLADRFSTAVKRYSYLLGLCVLLWTSIAFAQVPTPVRRSAPCDSLGIQYYAFRPSPILIPGQNELYLEARACASPSRVTLLQSGGEVDLLDNGTNGDRVAGDGIYTLRLPPAPIVANLQPADVFHRQSGSISVYSGTQRVQQIPVGVGVATAEIPPAEIRSFGPGVQATAHVVNLVLPEFYMSGTQFFLEAAQLAAQTFYRTFQDEYDFLDIIHLRWYPAQLAFHETVRDNVKGIGRRIFIEDSAQYGNPSRLLGFSMFPFVVFDGASQRHNHETGHQWINRLAQPLLADPVTTARHWPVSDLARGVMGYSDPVTGREIILTNDLVPLGTSRTDYKLVLNDELEAGKVSFTDLDLYLMGLLEPEKVQPHIIFPGVRGLPADGMLSGAVTVTINDVLASEGQRDPPARTPATPVTFRFATIAVSEQPLNPDEMRFLEYFAARMEARGALPTSPAGTFPVGNPFFVATGGRAQIDGHIFESTLSLDSTSYCVGASWSLRVSSAAPNASVRLLGASNGTSWEIPQWAITDANGNFSTSGIMPNGTEGTYTLRVEINGVSSNAVSFVVSNCKP